MTSFLPACQPSEMGAGRWADCRLGCTDNFCILLSFAMGTWPRGTNGWNIRPFRPLGAQPMAHHSVEVTRVPYAHAAHKWWNPQRLNKQDFIFDRFQKWKHPKIFWCLRKKPAQIFDALKRVLIGEGKISPTLLCVPPSELRGKIGCHCDALRLRFIVLT